MEFIQNPAVEGTQLARSGNDVVAVILPEPARKGQKINLRFVYGGEVLAEAGNGLLYVGERGTWYPNRGLAMSDFDLTFHYPPGWTLVATGKPNCLPRPSDHYLHSSAFEFRRRTGGPLALGAPYPRGWLQPWQVCSRNGASR